jgi:hypothetical protein
MSDLISAEAKAIYRARMMDLFETWKRPHDFVLYKSPQQSIVAIDPQFSSNWGSTAYGNNQVTYTEVKQTFDVRMWYPSFPQKYLTYQPDDVDIRVKMAQDIGTIKIQCLKECYDFLIQAEKAYIFDMVYRLDSDVRRLGIFDMELYSFTMAKQN